MAMRSPKHYQLGDAPADRARRRAEISTAYYKNREKNDVVWKFYNTPEWRWLRKTIMARRPLCVVCGKLAKHLDHIAPIRQNWSRRLDITNLQPLCHSCHSRKTAGFAGYKEFDE